MGKKPGWSGAMTARRTVFRLHPSTQRFPQQTLPMPRLTPRYVSGRYHMNRDEPVLHRSPENEYARINTRRKRFFPLAPHHQPSPLPAMATSATAIIISVVFFILCSRRRVAANKKPYQKDHCDNKNHHREENSNSHSSTGRVMCREVPVQG